VKSCYQVHEPEVALRTASRSRLEKPCGKQATLVRQCGFESLPGTGCRNWHRLWFPWVPPRNAALVSWVCHDHIPHTRRYIQVVWDSIVSPERKVNVWPHDCADIWRSHLAARGPGAGWEGRGEPGTCLQPWILKKKKKKKSIKFEEMKEM
jgi:hypothetical protein